MQSHKEKNIPKSRNLKNSFYIFNRSRMKLNIRLKTSDANEIKLLDFDYFRYIKTRLHRNDQFHVSISSTETFGNINDKAVIKINFYSFLLETKSRS